ncbi:hypothetical protein [Actinomadura roseirufa]|uniref:hypothetical protein n=1 Tax=Actinomadura roseirufa TaxID=2094049 RepID=UPI0010417EBB|nr:hypothetical protein [Actinomadura roseirufa]
MSGPYENEEDAYTEVRDIYSGHAKRGVMRARTLDMLLRTCAEHGVELGGYDRRVLGWLAAQPPETAQVVADLIARAAPAPAGGPVPRGTSPREAAGRAVPPVRVVCGEGSRGSAAGAEERWADGARAEGARPAP